MESKRKVIAARRAKYKSLIFPEGNKKDYEELPAHLKRGLKAQFATHFDEVCRWALGQKR